MARSGDLERSAIVGEAIPVNAVADDGWTHATANVGRAARSGDAIEPSGKGPEERHDY